MTTTRVKPVLNALIHEPARLSLMATLVECRSADFMFLAGVTGLTRGNLSTHLSKLVRSGYILELKEFVDRKPRTEYKITAAGQKAYKDYLKDWGALTGG